MRQRLCAPGPRQAVWELGQLPAALDTRAVASEQSQPSGLVCPLPRGHRQTDTLQRLPWLLLLQNLRHLPTMNFFRPSVLHPERLNSIFNNNWHLVGTYPPLSTTLTLYMQRVKYAVLFIADSLDRHDHSHSTDAETEAWDVLVT